jgi:murein DD-endopeptidase MepM/ murein hydrolase activator NlpD
MGQGMALKLTAIHRTLVMSAGLLSLAACSDVKDWDLRNMSGGFNTTGAAERATLARPTPDNRGVLSYPGYQVVVAKRGDTVGRIANRLGLAPDELARYNAISANDPLNEGEVIALPGRVAEPSPATGASTTGPIAPPANDQIDITTLATGAIDRAQTTAPMTNTGSGTQVAALAPQTAQPKVAAAQPTKHKVTRGETAYTIARLYNIPVRALADWNGLGPDLAVHEGQVLLIPVVDPTRTVSAPPVTPPGQPSPTPEPPSASKPLPTTTPPAASAATPMPASPNLGKDRTAASASKFIMPVDGKIIRPFSKKGEGIDISAAAGTAVVASGDGTVAAITKDTDGFPIIVIRHDGNLLSAYQRIDGVTVAKGDKVKRGQKIAVIRAGDPAFLHFVVSQGIEPIDPATVLN